MTPIAGVWEILEIVKIIIGLLSFTRTDLKLLARTIAAMID